MSELIGVSTNDAVTVRRPVEKRSTCELHSVTTRVPPELWTLWSEHLQNTKTYGCPLRFLADRSLIIPTNFTLKLVRPAFGPAAELPA